MLTFLTYFVLVINGNRINRFVFGRIWIYRFELNTSAWNEY